MIYSRLVAVCCLLVAGTSGVFASQDASPSDEAVNWVSQDIVKFVRRSAGFEEITQSAAKEFRRRDLDGGGISDSDRKLQQGQQDARARAKTVTSLLAMDIDGDGAVTRRELEQYFEVSIRRSLRQVLSKKDGMATEADVRKSRDRLVERELRRDTDRDGIITYREMIAPPLEKVKSSIELPPPYLDSDGNGVVSEDEYLKLVELVIHRADADANGKLSEQEKRAFIGNVAQLTSEIRKKERVETEIEAARNMSATCGFPAVPENARVILLETVTGAGLSDIGFGDVAAATSIGDVVIDAGDEPIYLVLSGSLPMIWRLGGATNRVVQVVAGVRDSRKGGAQRAGVIGLPASRVFVPAFDECTVRITGFKKADAELAAKKLAAILGRRVATTIVIQTLRKVAVPGGKIDDHVPLAGAVELPRDTPGQEMWRAMRVNYQGGLLRIDPATVRSRAKPVRHELLPGMAGLAQLADRGDIEILETGYGAIMTRGSFLPYPTPAKILVHKKIVLPVGLRSSTVYYLAPGVPAPENLPRGAKAVPYDH